MEIVELMLPAYLAPYLVNDDRSHMTDEEVNEIDTYLSEQGLRVVGCPDGEPEFRWSNDLNNVGSDCLLFTATQVA